LRVRWFAAVRSRGVRSGAAPELRAAQAQKGVADRIQDRTLEVSHSPVAAHRRTVAAHPSVAVDREADHTDHSREAARKHTAVARPPLVADHSREAGHSREAERTEVAYNQAVPPHTRATAATCRRRAAAYSRAVGDRSAEMGHKPVAVYKPAAATRNHAAIQKHTVGGDNRVAVNRSREGTHNRAASHFAHRRDSHTRPRRGALPR
jgi:hypothetical protein